MCGPIDDGTPYLPPPIIFYFYPLEIVTGSGDVLAAIRPLLLPFRALTLLPSKREFQEKNCTYG